MNNVVSTISLYCHKEDFDNRIQKKTDAAQKNNRIVILCTDEQNELIKAKAQAEGLNVSVYILKKVVE